ncbi:MAG: hypothetical protein GWO24_35015 [Akkermansiaceae bacterium]|nr:hypothetical protein [Akkermansiaceae bacterium]
MSSCLLDSRSGWCWRAWCWGCWREGYLTGSGILGDGAPAGRKAPQLHEVREEFSKGLEAGERGEMLRSFDEAVRRASRKQD